MDQVREPVVHFTHYVGWPLSTEINAAAERVIAGGIGRPGDRES